MLSSNQTQAQKLSDLVFVWKSQMSGCYITLSEKEHLIKEKHHFIRIFHVVRRVHHDSFSHNHLQWTLDSPSIYQAGQQQ